MSNGIYISSEAFRDAFDFRLKSRRGRECFAAPVTWEPHEEGAWVEPAFSLSGDDMQSLCDQLWVLGFRPSSKYREQSPEGSQRRHLEDMRAIVAAAYEVALPGEADDKGSSAGGS